jgi:DNA-binding NarL/FixJ family response regulator
MTTSILILEDDPEMQMRSRRIVSSLGLGQIEVLVAATIAQAKALVQQGELMLGLIDLGLPDGDGIDFIRWIRRTTMSLPLVVISAWSMEETVLGALRAGASGYLLKERGDQEIALSLVNVLKGGAPIDPFIARKIFGLIGEPVARTVGMTEADEIKLKEPLTKRELAIMAQVAEGLSNREIAAALNVSRWTVDTHVRHIYGKLAVKSRTQAVRAAHTYHLLG